jgi:hypothetical protein
MTDQADIVERLRVRWDSMTEMGNAERAEAADKIDELRRELYKMANMFGMCLGREMRRALYEGEG